MYVSMLRHLGVTDGTYKQIGYWNTCIWTYQGQATLSKKLRISLLLYSDPFREQRNWLNAT